MAGAELQRREEKKVNPKAFRSKRKRRTVEVEVEEMKKEGRRTEN